MARRFMSFCQDYSSHFIARGRNSTTHAHHYLSGLLGKQRRKNIETFCKEGFEKGARAVSVRQGAKGKLRVRFWAREVWSYTSGGKEAKPRMLLVRQHTDGAMKYTLTSFGKKTRWERLAQVQAQRYWIEHSFGEAKSRLGMAQCQVRKWRGWHHHMTLVCLAMLFVQKE